MMKHIQDNDSQKIGMMRTGTMNYLTLITMVNLLLFIILLSLIL